MSQDQTSSLLASLLLAQAGLQVTEPHIAPLSQQPRFPIQKPSQEYLSPYAVSNVQAASSLLASSQQPDFSRDMSNPAFAERVNETIARAKANGGREVMRGSLEWEAAREAVLADMRLPATTDSFGSANNNSDDLHMEARTGGRRGRGPRRRGSPMAVGTVKVGAITGGSDETPQINRGRGKSKGGRGGKLRSNRRARGGKGSMRSGKRKRSGDEDEGGHGNDNTDSSETFTPLPTQSRSGRKIFQANSGTSTIKFDNGLVVNAPLSSHPQTGLSGSAKKRKGNHRRPPGANALCKNCSRGHSPSSNVIVFCDGCNTPWHQYCHDPPIKGEIVQIEEKEWFCADCAGSREEQYRLDGTVSGNGMSFAEKRQYFQSLSQEHLVSLLLHACSLYPSLPVFPPKAAQSNISTISPNQIASQRSAIDSSVKALIEAEEDYEEDDVLPYPKPGNGITLRPESEDLAFLLDDDTVTFSHSWLEGPDMTPVGNGLMEMGGGALSVGA
ncbi:hypothetical protein MMC26_001901 [Xylographa opegraphella]|nr:hypothetical protein [Xylographa opegraphella]